MPFSGTRKPLFVWKVLLFLHNLQHESIVFTHQEIGGKTWRTAKFEPTSGSTSVPSSGPTRAPTRAPTREPTRVPTRVPTNVHFAVSALRGLPTKGPRKRPTRAFTEVPTKVSTKAVSFHMSFFHMFRSLPQKWWLSNWYMLDSRTAKLLIWTLRIWSFRAQDSVLRDRCSVGTRHAFFSIKSGGRAVPTKRLFKENAPFISSISMGPFARTLFS